MESYKDVVNNVPRGTDVLVTSHVKRLAPMLAGLEPDLIFVTGFPWRLPPELLKLPRLGSVNTHPALLPKYRGPNPLYWQVANGETEVGMTVHRMDPDFDTGPILAQGSAPIDREENIDAVVQKLTPLAGGLIIEALGKVLAGDPGRPQPTEGASYAPLNTEEDRVLNWSRPAEQLRNQVRAWGSRGAYAVADRQRWLVTRARVIPQGDMEKVEAGSVEGRPNGKLAVQTGDGLLVLEDAMPE
jgi:methionyl-tRNA formyltransferase